MQVSKTAPFGQDSISKHCILEEMAGWCHPRRYKERWGDDSIVCSFNLSVWPLKNRIMGEDIVLLQT